MDERRYTRRDSPVGMTSPHTEPGDMKLLAYQVSELGRGLENFQGEMSRSMVRIERKIDDNMETTMSHYDALDQRVKVTEQYIAGRREAERSLTQREERGLSDFQKWGIAIGVVVGIGGLVIGFLAVVATVVLALLN